MFRPICAIAVTCLMIGGLAACAKSITVPGTDFDLMKKDIKIGVVADTSTLNMDPLLVLPLAVKMRLYELKDPKKFVKIPLDELMTADKIKDLGADFVAFSEYDINPGHDATYTLKRKRATRFLGIVGLFQQPEPSYSRYVFEVSKVEGTGIELLFKDCYIQVIKGPGAVNSQGPVTDFAPVCPVIKVNVNRATADQLVSRGAFTEKEADMTIALRKKGVRIKRCSDLTTHGVLTSRRLSAVQGQISCE